MQIFGIEAHAKLLGYLKKLDERSEKFIFVGYAPNGYRVWDEKKQKIIVRRDVVFKKQSNSRFDDTNVIKINNFNINLEENYADDQEDNRQDKNKRNEQQSEEITKKTYSDTQEIKEHARDESEIRQENEIEYIYELSSEDEQAENEYCRTDRRGRKINLPKYYDDFVLLTYEEALNGPERRKWLEAVEEEKESLNKNQTWRYVDKSEAEGKRILSSKWVFRIKDNGKYKARLVIRGFEQRHGIDFQETFSPVVNMNCLRILFALAANQNYIIKTFDIKTDFYMENWRRKYLWMCQRVLKKRTKYVYCRSHYTV